MFSVTIVRTFSFGVYQRAKYASSEYIGRLTGEDEPLVVINKPGSVPTFQILACFGFAGAVSGAASTFIACESQNQVPAPLLTVPGPFELTKNAMVIAKQIATNNARSMPDSVSKSYQGKNTYRTARQIIRNCGVMGLYSGFQLQMGEFDRPSGIRRLADYCGQSERRSERHSIS